MNVEILAKGAARRSEAKRSGEAKSHHKKAKRRREEKWQGEAVKLRTKPAGRSGGRSDTV